MSFESIADVCFVFIYKLLHVWEFKKFWLKKAWSENIEITKIRFLPHKTILFSALVFQSIRVGCELQTKEIKDKREKNDLVCENGL